MGLALNFLLTILVELPLIILFFKRKKRQSILGTSFLINVVSWSAAHVILLTTDIDPYYVIGGIVVSEALAFSILLERNWKKGILISVIVNTLSFFITQLLPGDELLKQHLG